MQGFIQILQVFPSHPFPVPGSSPGIHVVFFSNLFIWLCQVLIEASCLFHVGPVIVVHRLSNCGIQAH